MQQLKARIEAVLFVKIDGLLVIRSADQHHAVEALALEMEPEGGDEQAAVADHLRTRLRVEQVRGHIEKSIDRMRFMFNEFEPLELTR